MTQPTSGASGAAEAQLNAIVTLRTAVSPWLIILQVSPDRWDLPAFAPGQYISLGLPGSASRCALAEAEAAPPRPDTLIRRPYSIASSPMNRDFMEFYVNLVPGGIFTPRLFDLDVGDRIWLAPRVAGTFTFDQVPQDANVILVANGSGLAPYISMLTTHLGLLTQRRVALIHGVRHSWDLGYRSMLLAMEHLRTNFTYIPVVSRPAHEPVPWRGAIGHVQDAWRAGILERRWGAHPSPEDTHVFLCGSPEMIDDMVALLAVDGFAEIQGKKPGQIHVERYWPKKRVRAPA